MKTMKWLDYMTAKLTPEEKKFWIDGFITAQSMAAGLMNDLGHDDLAILVKAIGKAEVDENGKRDMA